MTEQLTKARLVRRVREIEDTVMVPGEIEDKDAAGRAIKVAGYVPRQVKREVEVLVQEDVPLTAAELRQRQDDHAEHEQQRAERAAAVRELPLPQRLAGLERAVAGVVERVDDLARRMTALEARNRDDRR